MRRMIAFIKKDTVLLISWILAILSAFIVHPNKEYLSYIDFRTLGILFCLMCVMEGLRSLGVFDFVAHKLLKQVKTTSQLALVLILLCFFSSMLITNDVALITFVPLTLIVLERLPEQKEYLMIPVVVLQTIAANLGSMLTPIGNPQNLYLYGKAELSLLSFVGLMLPYTIAALVLLLIACRRLKKKESRVEIEEDSINIEGNKMGILGYVVLFILSLLTVARVIPFEILLVIVLIALLIFHRVVLKHVDYALLGTFVGFFIFIGNMGKIPSFQNFLSNIIGGHEIITSIVASQMMSNVPAALLLSGFTANYESLIIGTNLGGLGTLIASMASLISYKAIVGAGSEYKRRYFRKFTLANIVFLIYELMICIILKLLLT